MSQVPPGEIYVVERLDFLSIDLELVQILQHEVVGLLAKRSGTTIRRKFVKITSHPRVECSHKVTAFISYYKLIKIQLQNLNQTSASKSRSKISFIVLTKTLNLKILTKLQHQNLNLEILTKIQLQNIYKTSTIIRAYYHFPS